MLGDNWLWETLVNWTIEKALVEEGDLSVQEADCRWQIPNGHWKAIKSQFRKHATAAKMWLLCQWAYWSGQLSDPMPTDQLEARPYKLQPLTCLVSGASSFIRWHFRQVNICLLAFINCRPDNATGRWWSQWWHARHSCPSNSATKPRCPSFEQCLQREAQRANVSAESLILPLILSRWVSWMRLNWTGGAGFSEKEEPVCQTGITPDSRRITWIFASMGCTVKFAVYSMRPFDPCFAN